MIKIDILTDMITPNTESCKGPLLLIFSNFLTLGKVVADIKKKSIYSLCDHPVLHAMDIYLMSMISTFPK